MKQKALIVRNHTRSSANTHIAYRPPQTKHWQKLNCLHNIPVADSMDQASVSLIYTVSQKKFSPLNSP